MKKFLTMAAIALFALASCSKDDSTDISINDVNTQVLLKKMIVSINGGEPLTSIYNYSGNELSTITYSDGKIVQYSYNAQNLVTNIKEYYGEELTKNENLAYHEYSSLLRSIATTSYSNSDESQTITIGPNQHGDIIAKIFKENSAVKEYVVLFNGTNVISLTGQTSLNETITYSYDGKNNPFRNMAGHKFMVMARLKDGANNVIFYSRSGAVSPETSTIEYTFNSNNFPTASTETKSNGDIVTTQYFYE